MPFIRRNTIRDGLAISEVLLLLLFSFAPYLQMAIGAVTVTFKTTPSSVGSITFAGTTYTNGGSGSYNTGSYTATANVPTGWRFEFWDYDTTIKTTSIHVLNIVANPTTVEVNGAGWLGIWLSCAVTFYTSTGTGSITCGSNTYSSGQTYYEANVPHSYSVTANPPAGYSFSSWSTSGSVSVASGSSQSTTLTISGPGSITANFQAVQQYDITFYVRSGPNPAAGSVTLGGRTFTDGQVGSFSAGLYSLSATAPSPSDQWQFFTWDWGGSITISDCDAQSTTATVSGVGWIKAVFYAATTFYVNPV